MSGMALSGLRPGLPQASANSARIGRLTDGENAVLKYLARRPLHTFGMAGFIRDNGLVSVENRGEFFAHYDATGSLDGVALIGHFILFETESEAAIEAFAEVARQRHSAHLLLGEQHKVRAFWSEYSQGGQAIRLYCRENLMELRCPIDRADPVAGLRLATPADLDLVVPAHADGVLAESGVNPLESEPEAFIRRCLKRIELKRTWVWTEANRLIFKTDVQSDTPEVTYLEGIWVNPDDRGRGIARRCMSQLTRLWLQRASSVCLLVNENNAAAQETYRRAGFRFVTCYDTVFLK